VCFFACSRGWFFYIWVPSKKRQELDMAIITVSRQLGSGGDQIAEGVAHSLGYEHVDKTLVEEVAALTDTDLEEVEKFDEKGEGRVKFFLKRLLVPEVVPGSFPLSSAAYFPEFGLEFPYAMDQPNEGGTTFLDRGTYQLLITTILQDLGATGNAVVVGRAGQVILGNHKEALHIRVVAPFDLRCERVMQARGMNRENAEELVKQHDRWRKLYLHNYHGVDWDDPLLYHLTINTGSVEEESAVDLVTRYVVHNS